MTGNYKTAGGSVSVIEREGISMCPLRIIIAVTFIIAFGLLSVAAGADIEPGCQVRIVTTDSARYQGLLFSVDSESFTVSSQFASRSIDRGDVARMWRGKPATIEGAALGLFAGIAAGLTYYVIDRDNAGNRREWRGPNSYSGEPRPLSDYTSTIIFYSGAGLMAGALIGSIITKWSPIDEAEFGTSAGMINTKGLRLQVSLRF